MELALEVARLLVPHKTSSHRLMVHSVAFEDRDRLRCRRDAGRQCDILRGLARRQWEAEEALAVMHGMGSTYYTIKPFQTLCALN